MTIPAQPAPLADRMRPATLEAFVGQGHIMGPGQPLTQLILRDRLPSLLFWGPPGCGKTTLARLIARHTQAEFFAISAVLAGVKELRQVLDAVGQGPTLFPRRAILFIDEIHRWNRAQQDALLPHIEDGRLTLIGATTENPSFEVIGPLLSRCKTFILSPLGEPDLATIVRRALTDTSRGLGAMQLKLPAESLALMIAGADGDARRALNTLEIAAELCGKEKKITTAIVEAALQKKMLRYDQAGEEHYNVISAFIKSMRASDPDAAVYYLARMYEAGEDPRFIARRMVIFAAEDIGTADPQALGVAVAAAEAFDRVGQAEGWIPLAEGVLYLAKAPKSKACYQAYLAAKSDLEAHGTQPVPMGLRNPVTDLMKEAGYGKGDLGGSCLPDTLKGKIYYKP